MISFVYEDNKYSDDYKLNSPIAKDISELFDRNNFYFEVFNKIILCYDYR